MLDFIEGMNVFCLQEAVRRSFLVTGLTVAANRSEDHFIENPSMIPKPTGSAVQV